MSTSPLPSVPAPLAELPRYLAEHPDQPMTELLAPYRRFEAKVREMFAQTPDDPALRDPYVNVLPIFGTEKTEPTQLRVRARNLAAESAEEKARYIMPLPDDNRRASGDAAVVTSLKAFQANFAVFCEASLVGLDWSNVVAAGSSVVNCLLPVPERFQQSRRALREYYHEKFCPASDVDLFLYGLTEEQAVEKMKAIEAVIQGNTMYETTAVRTKNAVTICSQYPSRHVQIVLRVYKSVSEILTGFDIDASGAAYDGNQVYCTPRAIQSYITQINHIDLSRRSPSYENRLSKYSHRNFEIYWPQLDRSRVDPTIFERSFKRTVGLARLLVLESLPTPEDRDAYARTRRNERQRPLAVSLPERRLKGNIKDDFDDEIAEWIHQPEVSSYTTFVLPYGIRFRAKKIEKLCYVRDMLLNAEWNKPKDRQVNLHRHPAFFGRVEDVVGDCCGFCPKPTTDEEKEVAKEESKMYISGNISFLTDDPGRQQIGSFNPLTADDWTEMAYIGDTQRLCQAIVDCDLQKVQDWLRQKEANPNQRDHVGRTPLHLAVMASTPEIVQTLVDGGSRLISRLADGRTALHLAAQRGDVVITKILLDKSSANEAEEDERKDACRREKAKVSLAKQGEVPRGDGTGDGEEEEGEEEDGEMVDAEDSDDGALSMTTASFAKVKPIDKSVQGGDSFAENEEDPDVFNINITAWDAPCSALHFAVIDGHAEVVQLLCQEYGADIFMPIKYYSFYFGHLDGVKLTPLLALMLPHEQAIAMTRLLLDLGASCAQADCMGVTVFQSYVEANIPGLIDEVMKCDKTGVLRVLDHISFRSVLDLESPLTKAIDMGDVELVRKLLEAGASTSFGFDAWFKSLRQLSDFKHMADYGRDVKQCTNENRLHRFLTAAEQPLLRALTSENPATAMVLLDHGADPDTKTIFYWQAKFSRFPENRGGPGTALELLRLQLQKLRDYEGEKLGPRDRRPIDTTKNSDAFLATLDPDSWQHWAACQDVLERERTYRRDLEGYEERVKNLGTSEQIKAKRAVVNQWIRLYESLEKTLMGSSKENPTDSANNDKKDSIKHPTANAAEKEEPVQDYSFKPDFPRTTDLHGDRQEGYVQLLEAAWKGDFDTIKKLTLSPWRGSKGDGDGDMPLNVSAVDTLSNSAFSLAFIRGHYQVAAGILEVAEATYVSEKTPIVRYELNDLDGDDDDGGENERGFCDEYELYRTVYQIDQFTIDSIGEATMQLEGLKTPVEIIDLAVPHYEVVDGKVKNCKLGRMSLFQLMYEQNNMTGLKFLMDAVAYYHGRGKGKGKNDTGDTSPYGFRDFDFYFALGQGRIEMLAELIKRTGAGLPVEGLAEETGLDMSAQSPKQYAGLTVYGKKRSNWAMAGRETISRKAGTKKSPLLLVAAACNTETVEWFLGTEPLRCYLEYAASKAGRADVHLRHLGQAQGGLEGVISHWLNHDRNLVLLEAIKCRDNEKLVPMVKYLIRAVPESVSAKDADGLVPLSLACAMGRVEVARLLIENGADQMSRRDKTLANCLHSMLRCNMTKERLVRLLELFEAENLARMAGQRCKTEGTSETGRTPLHALLARYTEDTEVDGYWELPFEPFFGQQVGEMDKRDIVEELLKLSGGRELGVLDSTGNTPLHYLAMMGKDTGFIRAVLEATERHQQHALLRRENAAGMTPLEAAHVRFLQAAVKAPEYGYRYGSSFGQTSAADQLIRAHPRQFVMGEDGVGHWQSDHWRPGRGPRRTARLIYTLEQIRSTAEAVLNVFREFSAKYPGQRRLCSLNEANDVAGRLDKVQPVRYGAKVKG